MSDIKYTDRELGYCIRWVAETDDNPDARMQMRQLLKRCKELTEPEIDLDL